MKTKIFEPLQNKILSLIATHKKIFVAYSGGLDSHVLLHILAKLTCNRKNTELTAIHIDHGVNPKAKLWVKHCQGVCKRLRVNFITHCIKLKQEAANIHSPEELLRNLRYEIFSKLLPTGGCLLTAHHANDQAETLLLQLFRGAGPKGLAAMPKHCKFAQGCLVRPFLDIERTVLWQYACKHRLKWIEDDSNTNVRFDRNFIRHKLLPVVLARWPKVITTLNRAAHHCAEANELLEVLGVSDLQAVKIFNDKNTIDIKLLKKVSLIRQKNIPLAAISALTPRKKYLLQIIN